MYVRTQILVTALTGMSSLGRLTLSVQSNVYWASESGNVTREWHFFKILPGVPVAGLHEMII